LAIPRSRTHWIGIRAYLWILVRFPCAHIDHQMSSTLPTSLGAPSFWTTSPSPLRYNHSEHQRRERYSSRCECWNCPALVRRKRVSQSVFLGRLCRGNFLTPPGPDSAKRYLRGSYTPPGSRPTSLIDSTRAFFSRSRPQYQSYADTRMSWMRSDLCCVSLFFFALRIRLSWQQDSLREGTE
jgi:hypothetical protein